ncbi:MAG: conjugal transfer protein TraX [Clostridia bacterium]|nr:conjugal transfer protein TraX [Clostridia bacterium]
MNEPDIRTMPAARGLSRGTIKYIAIFMMTLNHIGSIFLYGTGSGHDLLGLVFIGLGYFTAPAMLYFMADGIYYTGSIPRYALRLGIFAVISQLPYSFASSAPDGFEFGNFSFMTTLLVCLLMLWAFKALDENGKLPFVVKWLLKVVVLGAAVLLTTFCDWAQKAPIYAAEFYLARQYMGKIKLGWIFVLLTHAVFMAEKVIVSHVSVGRALLYFFCTVSGPVFAAIVICAFYKGGMQKRKNKFGKWFFYIYYPAHLAILGAICYLINEQCAMCNV